MYLAKLRGKNVYVGITNNWERRRLEHLSRFEVQVPFASGLTRGEARAIEQAMIVRARERDLKFLNKINSISPLRGETFSGAVNWGEVWLNANGIY